MHLFLFFRGLEQQDGRLQLFQLLILLFPLLPQRADLLRLCESCKPDLLGELLLGRDTAPDFARERGVHVPPAEGPLELEAGRLSPFQEGKGRVDPVDAPPQHLDLNYLGATLAEPRHDLVAEALPAEGSLQLDDHFHELLGILHDAVAPALALDIRKQVFLNHGARLQPSRGVVLRDDDAGAALNFRRHL